MRKQICAPDWKKQIQRCLGIGSLLAFIFFTGCAGNRHVTLSYPPQDKYGRIVESCALVTKLSKPTAIAIQVTDNRKGKEPIGIAKNTYGKVLGDISVLNNPVQWITEALVMELTKKGYKMVQVEEAERNDSTPVFLISIDAIRCDVYMAYDAEVSLAVGLSMDSDSTVLRRKYTGSVVIGENLGASSKECGRVLGLALFDCIVKLAAEIHSAYVIPYISSREPVQPMHVDTESVESAAFKRAQARIRGASASRAAALAKTAVFKRFSQSSRTQFDSYESDKNKEKEISKRKELILTAGIFSAVLTTIISFIAFSKEK